MKNRWWLRFRTTVGENKGFTLLETMIGMMIFAVGISAVLCMEVTAINDHIRSKDHVEKVQGAAMQSETIVKAFLYNDEAALVDDGGNSTTTDAYGADAMPVHESNDHASYSVRNDQIVRDVRMIYMSNRVEVDAKKFTLGVAMPNKGRVN
jgi:prepilin-type N-terminal cleavage/methylation domain-containing protein